MEQPAQEVTMLIAASNDSWAFYLAFGMVVWFLDYRISMLMPDYAKLTSTQTNISFLKFSELD